MIKSLFYFNIKRTVFSAHNRMLLRGLLVLSFLCSVSENYADNVDFNTALHIAKTYVNVSKKAALNVKTRAAATTTHQPYYVFNDDAGKGFVVIAGDDKMGKVLAYSHEASIDMANLNPEARYLFDSYRQVYEELGKNKTLTTRASKTTRVEDAVEPLLKSKWGQYDPYDKLTHYPTGCVATAVAQVMYYHQWPEKGKGTASYTVTYDKTIRSADFSQSHYDWANMLPDYKNKKSTVQQRDAVALLMNDVGIATAMQYTPHASGTQSYMAERALRDYFDYDAALIERSDEGIVNFVDILKKEIRNGFPLYMSGTASGGGSGHAWVCDGFDNEDRFHMNLGWDGQADGYYSVTALSITSTGQEFNGKPLAFNRKLHVIAIHPNKPNTPKLDTDIAYKSPNISFRLGSEMTFIGDVPTALSDNVKLMYSNFTNQSNEPFEGEVGVGLYDEEGKLVKTFPYSKKGTDIFTKAHFIYSDGKMVSGAFIEEAITFTLDFSTLTNGTYTLSPIAAILQKNATLGAWARMKKAPRVMMKVESGKISYLELPSKTPSYQLAAEPKFSSKLITGETNSLQLYIRKLDAQRFDGRVKVDLINSRNEVIYSSQTTSIVDFDMYATTRVRLPFNLPYGVTPGEYHLRTTITNADNQTCQVHDRPLQGSYKVQIEDGKKPETFANIRIFIQDNSENSIPSEEINVLKSPTFRINCMAFLGKNVHYKGSLTLYLIDNQTDVSIPVMKKPLQVDLTKEGSMTMITSDWIDPKVEQLINNRRYRVALIGVEDGRNIDLIPSSLKPTFISIINNGATNGINETRFKDIIQFSDGRLYVQQQGLKRVEVYAMNGALVTSSTANGTDNLSLTLPKGTYVVRITTQGGRYTSVIR